MWDTVWSWLRWLLLIAGLVFVAYFVFLLTWRVGLTAEAGEPLTWAGKIFAAEEAETAATKAARASAATRPGRVYAVVPVWHLGKAGGPYVCTWGTVSLVAKDATGDWYLRIADGREWIAARIIPRLPIEPPKLGAAVNVCGIRNMEEQARWEIHPVEYITPAEGRKAGSP